MGNLGITEKAKAQVLTNNDSKVRKNGYNSKPQHAERHQFSYNGNILPK